MLTVLMHTMQFGGDVGACHNTLRNAMHDFCKSASLNSKLEVEAGACLGHGVCSTSGGDIWCMGKNGRPVVL